MRRQVATLRHLALYKYSRRLARADTRGGRMYKVQQMRVIALGAALTGMLNVAEARNQAPTITGTPPTAVVAGQAYNFTPTAKDADGNKLSFSVSNKPSWAAFSTATGKLSGTPTSTQTGAYSNIKISVSDGRAAASLPQFSITVKAGSTSAPPPVSGGTPPDLGTNANMHGMQVFPASDPWNEGVDLSPVDPNSAVILGKIGTSTALHPDFGANYDGGPFGIPYVVVPDSQPKVSVTFDYADESDAGPYPIPANPPIEPGDGDNHLLMITQGERHL